MAHFEKVSFEQYKKDRLNLLGNFSNTITDKKIKKEYDAIKLPQRGTVGSMGYDFYSPFMFTLKSEWSTDEYETIPTGIKFVVDDDVHLGLLCVPRSGLGFRYAFSLSNTLGVIDQDYQYAENEGHIMAKVTAKSEVTIEQGKAFMQGIIIPFIITSDDDATGIRNGGFGSTDRKIEAVEIKEKETG